MPLISKLSEEGLRLIFFLLVSLFLHLLVYLVADHLSLFSAPVNKERSQKVDNIQGRRGGEFAGNQESGVSDLDKPLSAEGGYMSGKKSGNRLSRQVEDIKRVVKYVRVDLLDKLDMKHSEGMYDLYLELMKWFEIILEKFLLLLLKLNV